MVRSEGARPVTRRPVRSRGGVGWSARLALALLAGFCGLVAPPAAARSTDAAAGPSVSTQAATPDPLGQWTIAAKDTTRSAQVALGSDGNVWYLDSTGGVVGRVTPSGTITTTSFASSAGGGLVAGPDGNLWFSSGSSIVRMTPTFQTTLFPAAGAKNLTVGPDSRIWFFSSLHSIGAISTAGVVSTYEITAASELGALVAGPDGNIWFTRTSPSAIGRITIAGVELASFTGSPISRPRGIGIGPDGDVWFVNGDTSTRSFVRITAAGVMTSIVIPDYVFGFTTGPDGNVWARTYGHTGEGPDTVLRMTPAGVVAHFDVGATTDRSFGGIVTGADGNLWVGLDHGIGRITTSGVASTFTAGAFGGPESIVTGPDGNLWYTNFVTGSIGRRALDGTWTLFTGNGIDHPHEITVGPDGNLWFTNAASIGRITPTGTTTIFPDPELVEPVGITTGPDGNLWFTDKGADTVGRMTTAGVVTTFAHPTTLDPHGITTGADGNLWFTNLRRAGSDYYGSISRVTPTGTISNFATRAPASPMGIVAAPDGNVWFTANSQIGRIRPDGVETLFDVPKYTQATDLAVGPDGLLWFVSNAQTAVGRVTLDGTVYLRTWAQYTSYGDMRGATFGPDGNFWFADRNGSLSRVGTARTPAPSNLVVTNVGGGKATATWTRPGTIGAMPVDHWIITPSMGAEVQPPLSEYAFGQPGALVLGTAYTFTVTPISTFGPGVTSDPSPPMELTRFLDVGLAHPFIADIDWLVDEGIASGYPGSFFLPAAPVTRQALSAFLYRASGANVETQCASAPFTDVPATHPFCSQIQWMVDQGLAGGYPDGSFHPGATVSRQAMAAFLYRFAGAPGGEHPPCPAAPFPDIPVGHPFCGEIRWLVDHGIATGYPDGTFHPTAGVSRQAAAAFLHRLDGVLHP